MSEDFTLGDGCYQTHDPTKSYCVNFKGRRSRFPRFPNIEDLVTIEKMAEQLGVKRNYLANARYADPPLPWFRFGRVILVSKQQVAWWLNEIQDTQVDKYFLDRKRRVAEGTFQLAKGRLPKPSDMKEMPGDQSSGS